MLKFFSKKQLVFFSILVVILIGSFLRAYNFSPWLHFELDQARDARVVDAALEGGPGELTLLGPKAGGTFLRLAPGFYYLEYLSALVFGVSPAGMAGFVLFFSILSIPLFYLFIRRFFDERLAIGLTLLFSVSEFFVMYGRFAWNPNLIPFFLLLGFYGALRSVDTAEIHRERWFLVAIGSLVLATHFHFLVFLAVPAILGAFLLVKRPRFSWKTWVGAFALAFVLYLPMGLNEIKAGGTNTEQFFDAITKKSSKSDHTIIEKAMRNVSEHALYGLVITTGFEGGTFPALVVQNGKLQSLCLEKCDRGKWYGVASVMVMFAGIATLLYFWWRERDQVKKDFLLLSGIWLGVTFVLFLPLSYSMAPRFFLLSGVLFFVLIGFLLSLVIQTVSNKKIATLLCGGIIAVLVYSNLSFLMQRFSELSRAGVEAVASAPDRILKEPIRVTLEQQERIVDMLELRSKETGFPVYMFSIIHHRRALKYLMEKRGIENDVLGFSGIYRQGVYYIVLRSQANIEKTLEKYKADYTIGTRTPFGTLLVIELHPKPESVMGERQDFSLEENSVSTAPPRFTWREFFESDAETEELETPLEESEQIEEEEL